MGRGGESGREGEERKGEERREVELGYKSMRESLTVLPNVLAKKIDHLCKSYVKTSIISL